MVKITPTPTTGRSDTNKESTFNDNNESNKITNYTNEGGTENDKNYPVVLKMMTSKKTNCTLVQKKRKKPQETEEMEETTKTREAREAKSKRSEEQISICKGKKRGMQKQSTKKHSVKKQSAKEAKQSTKEAKQSAKAKDSVSQTIERREKKKRIQQAPVSTTGMH
ncbi:18492_t:CDS:2 [Gigaspora margarita]|uniref:18492_t:CDS:1 n=1 Tax=Gigaspora margarita TaxID=4874 RepID=A0ABN7UTS2_GIGMA|nr:18492_t:CDS:2 [Gigaspora margarita]